MYYALFIHTCYFYSFYNIEFPAAFVVPYVVLSELDRLKNNNLRPAYLQHVRRVIDLLQHSLLERHPRVIGQSAEDSKKQMDKDLNLSTIDNSVINCCLQYQKQGLDVVRYMNSLIACLI